MEEELFWNLDDDMMTDGMPAGGPASEPDPNPTQNPVEYDSGVYASLWDTDDDSVGDLLLLGSLPSVVDHLPTGYTGTLITNYDNVDNNTVTGKPLWWTSDYSGTIKTCVIVDVIYPGQGKDFFRGQTSLTQIININNFNWTQMKFGPSFEYMFGNCPNLTSLDLSSWVLSGFTNMTGMFSSCRNLTSLVFGSNFDTSSVTLMTRTFSGCSKLTTLDLSMFDTQNVTDMTNMISTCSRLTNLDISNFNTSKVTGMGGMFMSDAALTTIDLRSFDTHNVVDMLRLFQNCSSLRTILVDWTKFSTSKVTNMENMFSYAPLDVNSFDFSRMDTSKVTDMSSMFNNCKELSSLDLSNWDTSNVANFNYMFNGCVALTTLTLPRTFVTSNAKQLPGVFYNCSQLTSIDVSNWDTSNVTTMNQLFSGCRRVTELHVENWDTSNVTDMTYLFFYCQALTSVDLHNFNTSKVQRMQAMFYSCLSLTSLDLSSFDTSNVTTMEQMFVDLRNVQQLNINHFNTNSLNNVREMFNGCKSITELDLSNFDTSRCRDMYRMFSDCDNLTTIYVSSSFSTQAVTASGAMFQRSPKLVGQAGTTYNDDEVDVSMANVDTWDTKGYFSTKGGIVPLSAPEVKRITSNMPDTNNTITSKIKPPVTYNIAPPLPSGTSNGLTFTTSGSGITHIEGTSTGTINYQEFISQVSPGGDCVIDVSYRGQLQGQASVILKGDENRTLATIDLNSDNKREVFFLSHERAIYYYCISCSSGVTFDGDFCIQVYFDSDIEYDVDVETDYFPTVENPLFNLLGLQIYNDTTQTWDTVWEKHSNETIIDENLSLIIRNLQNNLSTGDGMVLRYVSGFTNATKYYYNLEANKTYRARLVRRVQNATDMYDGISDEFGIWIPEYADLSDFIFTMGAIYNNGYGYIVALGISTNNLSPADLEPIDTANIKHYTSINQNKRTPQSIWGGRMFMFKDFYNGEGAKQEKNNSNSYTHYIEFPYIDNYYTEDVIDKLILSQVVNSTAQDPITSLTTPTITLNNGVLSVKHLSLHSNVANMTLSGETLDVVMEISKTNDFALLTYSQTKQFEVSDVETYYLDFDDITLARGDSGMNYIRFRTVYSNNQDVYSYTQEISPTYSIEFIIIDPVIDSFTIQLNAQNQIVATVVETTGVPLSVITLEVYKTPTGPLFAEIPLNTGQATILPYTEPGTSYYFKARATNVGATVYALDDEPDPATGEYLPKILYCKIPLEYTPDYENVAQPHITAQKIQLNQTSVLRFDWTNIVTNAYQTKYNITVISDNTISPSTFEDIQSGMTYQFEDRIDGEHVKFALECQLISSDGTVLKQFMIESPQVELDAVDLVNPSISYSTDRTYHSIKYILNNITKNNYKLAYELLQLKDNNVIIQEKETGDVVPTPSSPDLEGTTELLFDNLDANKSYTLTYKYIFVNPLDSSKTYTITDTISVSTLELLLYAIRNEQVVIDHQIVNQPSTKSNYAISWTEPLEGSEPVTNYIIRYKKNDESLYHSVETSTIHTTLLATDLGLNNEDVLHLDIGVKYTLYDNSEQIIWKSLNDITVAITDYVLYRTSYPNTEVMMRKLFRAAESDSAEQLVREIQSL